MEWKGKKEAKLKDQQRRGEKKDSWGACMTVRFGLLRGR
jgi:hypothetical protein